MRLITSDANLTVSSLRNPTRKIAELPALRCAADRGEERKAGSARPQGTPVRTRRTLQQPRQPQTRRRPQPWPRGPGAGRAPAAFYYTGARRPRPRRHRDGAAACPGLVPQVPSRRPHQCLPLPLEPGERARLCRASVLSLPLLTPWTGPASPGRCSGSTASPFPASALESLLLPPILLPPPPSASLPPRRPPICLRPRPRALPPGLLAPPCWPPPLATPLRSRPWPLPPPPSHPSASPLRPGPPPPPPPP